MLRPVRASVVLSGDNDEVMAMQAYSFLADLSSSTADLTFSLWLTMQGFFKITFPFLFVCLTFYCGLGVSHRRAACRPYRENIFHWCEIADVLGLICTGKQLRISISA